MIGLLPWMMAAQSEPDPREAFPLQCLEGITNAAGFPILEIQVNVHFIGSGEAAFVPGENNAPMTGSDWNGNWAARQMIIDANEVLKDLQPNPAGLADFLHDSRIRLKIYTDPGNSSDLYDGIWYHETLPEVDDLEYGGSVLHILVKDGNDGGSDPDGSSCGFLCNHLFLYDWYSRLAGTTAPLGNNPYGAAVFMAKVTLHEIGHIMGLCHSFYAFNECRNVDIDVEAECHSVTPGGVGGSCGQGASNCDFEASTSTNIMCYQSPATSLSPCQWKIYYGRLLGGDMGKRPEYVKFTGCDVGIEPPITIVSGTSPTWTTTRVVGGPVIIEPNATLTITCVHFFGTRASIRVMRGGKLKILNGALYAACGEPSWEGIYVEGNANEEQPDPTHEVTTYDDHYAGVVYLDNAYISGAYTAISTTKYGEHWNSSYWGGVVYALSSTFENNRRGVEFMAYSKENKSVFKEDCIFREFGNAISNTRGVTIWNCYGIEFEDNLFKDMDIAGIYGIDFGLTNVERNQFTGCNRGIEIYTTSPLTNFNFKIGDLPDDANIFTHGIAGIYAESNDELRGLQVFNNLFTTNNNGIYLTGRANFDIRHNTFYKNTAIGLQVWQSGKSINDLRCNYFYDPGFFCTSLNGNNSGLRILYNDFELPGFRDIRIQNVGATPGQIAGFQGGFGNPADNCFSASNKAIETIGNTALFRYFVLQDSAQVQNCNLLPTATSGTNNYTIQPTNDNGDEDCDNEDLPGLIPRTKPELLQARDVLAQAEAEWQASHGSLESYGVYLQALDDKNVILKSLLIGALDAQNYTEATTLLTEEGTPEAQQWLLSVKLIAKDFSGAQQVWNALPFTTQDEQWFRDIMQVNLQRLQNIETYALSSSQETTLYTIADSESPYRSYARSLLALLKEERFPLDEIDIEAPMGEAPQTPQNAQIQAPVFSVAPNPASDVVEVRYPVSQQQLLPKLLWLINLSGGVSVKQINLDDSGLYRLGVRDLPSGVYLLRISDKAGVLYQTKLVILP